MDISKGKSYLVLFIILFIAVILRFWHLGTIPIGFNDDESAFGYNAYSILKTGHDEWGRLLPFPVFESFGDWKLVGYLYPVVISQFFLGVNEFATRFPSALIGVFAVIATYFLTKELFKKDKYAELYSLVSALLLAISPWHIVASRNAFESDTLILPITLGVLFFIKGSKRIIFLYFSMISFAICLFIYRSAWLFVPLLIIALIFRFKNIVKMKITQALVPLVMFLLIVSMLVPSILSFKGQSRFIQESFITGVSNVGIINEVNEKRGKCEIAKPGFMCKALYNKYTSFFATYFNNYFNNLSPQTYFTGSPSSGYQSFSNRGLHYSFELPLFVAGLYFLIKRKEFSASLLVAWILLAPIGASFAGVGNPGRLNLVMPAPQIIEAFGLVSVILAIKNFGSQRLFATVAFFIISFSIVKLWTDMFDYYPYISGSFQRYGYKQLFDFIESNRSKYNYVYISRYGDDAKQYIHYLFFEKYDPKTYLISNTTIKKRGGDNWIDVEQIGNIKFYASPPGADMMEKNSMLVLEGNPKSIPFNQVFTVNYLNGDRVFTLYSVNQN